MSLLTWLFGPPTTQLECPYCLDTIRLTESESTCPGCTKEVPPDYRDEYQAVPPFFVPLLGWTSSGKTMALMAMTLTIEELPRIWPGFSYTVASQETRDWLQSNRQQFLATGTLADSTDPTGEQPAYMMLMRQFLRWRGRGHSGRTLVVRDFAGEHFKNLTIPADQMRFIKQANTVMMMFCLSDLENVDSNQTQFAMHELLETYISTLRRSGTNVKNKRTRVVIVLSQADRMYGSRVLPAHLENYLMSDPIAEAVQTPGAKEWDNQRMAEYVEEMSRASDHIQEFLMDRHASARNLRNLANDNRISLKFCITSATGADVDRQGGKLVGKPVPRRILDPLFSALEFETVPAPV
jgi:hypothetical protein